MSSFYKLNTNHPSNYVLSNVADMAVETVWGIQSVAHKQHKGLIAQVSDNISKGFLEDRGFETLYHTYFSKLNVRDYKGNPVISILDLEDDLKHEVLLLLRDHYERINRVNPASANIDYRQLTYNQASFDFEHSIVRLSRQHVVAAILIFQAQEDYRLGWTFGDDVPTIIDLWHDLLGILPVSSVLYADFRDTDYLGMSVYHAFNWHRFDQPQTTLLWRDNANNLR